MFKISLSSKILFGAINNIALLKHFFVFRLDRFHELDQPALMEVALRSTYVTDGTSKQTHQNRFSDLSPILDRLPKESLLQVHDVGVSSGVTSLELWSALKTKGYHVELSISDKFSKIHILKKRGATLVYDNAGKFMCAYLGPIFAYDAKFYFPLSKLVFLILKWRTWTPPADQTVLLYDPKVIEFIASKQIKDVDYDIFESKLEPQFHFVRCMNLLNLSYFTEKQICSAIDHLRMSIVEGGHLLVGRSVLGQGNHASLLQKVNDRWKLITQHGKGSEIIHLFPLSNGISL